MTRPAAPRSRRWVPVVVAGLAGLLACLDPLEPDVGPLLREACDDQPRDPDFTASFARDIDQEILEPRCYSCHASTADNPIGYDATGLDVSSYTGLRSGGASSGTDIVIPGSPCRSILVQKTGEAPPFGSRMPLTGPPYLDQQQRDHLHDWILQGALDN